jgi:hypothetical protein
MRKLIAIAALLLTGCAHTRYVTIHCLTKEQFAELQKQKPEKIRDQLTGKADEDTRILGGALIRWQTYGIGLENVLDGCSER